MQQIGEITKGKYGKKFIWISCPMCSHPRWMRLEYYIRGKKTGICRKCFGSLTTSKGKRWGNGHTHEGYVFVRKEGHPRANKQGYVKRAVLVMEESMRRYLQHNEHTHHINKIRDDDRWDNLLVLSNSEHSRLHAIARHLAPPTQVKEER